MNRIAITGSFLERTILANALSAMTGFDIMISPTYSHTAYKYKLNSDISKCQWPDSYVYCLETFTQRVIVEQKYGDRFISDGSVMQELGWIKSRYPQNDLIYEQSMINSLEKVIVEYASNSYDYIFHLGTHKEQDITDQCMLKIFSRHFLDYKKIDCSDKESALDRMLEYLHLKPVLSAEFSLFKASGNQLFENPACYENRN